MKHTINKDIVIIGGGIAGLWALNRLRNEGFDALLLEDKALGSGQSIASQGMIHGGMKYALGGAMTRAANAIADMPDHWRACLQGKGDVDLQTTRILSEQYYMWPSNSLRSRFNAFLGSKAIKGKASSISKDDYPAFLKGNIDGPLYQLKDIVLDVPSLLETLSQNYHQHIRKIDWQHSKIISNKQEGIESLVINGANNIEIKAQRFLITSGERASEVLNNASLSQSDPIEMQLRPLQMTMVKHQLTDPIYLHCIADQLTTTPEVTITSHQCKDGDWVWYLGGELAESGANISQAEQIKAAKEKLQRLFPWCDLHQAKWDSFYINRAEAKQVDGRRPETPSLVSHDNMIVCWPTKLTLAPNMANETLKLLQAQKIQARPQQPQPDLSFLPFPGIAQTPWDTM